MKNLYLTVPAFLLLTACGGGSSNPVEDNFSNNEDILTDVTNDSNSDGGNTDGGNTDGGNTDGGNTDGGNTGDGDTDVTPPAQPITYSSTALKMSAADRVRDQNGQVLSLANPMLDGDAAFTLTANTDGTYTLEQGTRSVLIVLDGSENGVETYRGGAGRGDPAAEIDGTLVPEFFAGGTTDNEVFTGLLIVTNYDERIEGYVPVGIVSDAATVDQNTGTATFTGVMNGRIIGPFDDFTPRNGLGGGSLSVDFDQNTVSGNFSIRNPSYPDPRPANADEFPRMDVTLNESAITGNGFDGTATIAFVDGGGLGEATLTPNGDATYSGNFFGDTATSAGGTVSSTFDNAGEDYVFQGGFSTTQPD